MKSMLCTIRYDKIRYDTQICILSAYIDFLGHLRTAETVFHLNIDMTIFQFIILTLFLCLLLQNVSICHFVLIKTVKSEFFELFEQTNKPTTATTTTSKLIYVSNATEFENQSISKLWNGE